MKTKWWAVVLMLICTVCTAFGQIFMKWGTGIFASVTITAAVFLFFGLALYAVGAMLNIISLKGGDLSIIFPIFALNYIWVSFLSWLWLGEPMGVMKWVGMGGIVLGISLIGIGSKHKRRKN